MTPEGNGAAFRRVALEAGLYLVATPIGNARDITLRALDILASADVIAAEDTRTARRLMDMHGVPVSGRPMIAYHDHNGPRVRPGLLARLTQGQSIAYMSEAGTPLVADPGYQLARAASSEGLFVTVAPGPSAALAALSLAALPSDRFLFAGFPPTSSSAQRKWVLEVSVAPATLVLFEAPTRVHRTLSALCDTLGEQREGALCRELTKKFEEVRRGTLAELRDGVAAHPPKGEIVLVIDRAAPPLASAADLETALQDALLTLPLRDAAKQVAQDLGLRRRDVYQAALALKDGKRPD